MRNAAIAAARAVLAVARAHGTQISGITQHYIALRQRGLHWPSVRVEDEVPAVSQNDAVAADVKQERAGAMHSGFGEHG